MKDMGRPKTAWHDLPPRMTARKLASGKILYYYQARGKKKPLGSDFNEAKRQWVDLETGGFTGLFPEIAKQYRKAAFETLAPSSKIHYEIALRNLEGAFKSFRLEQIEPQHVKQYIRKRSKKAAALFEKRILSALFAWARETGVTSTPNPCAGVKFSNAELKRFKIGTRKRYVTDAEFSEVHARGDDVLQDAMDLALVTAQRPSDLLTAKRQDIREGVLWFTQAKTGATVGVRVEDALERVIERILARKRPSMYLLSDRQGQRVTYAALSKKFRLAKGDADWQFRDIRAKAASDSPSLKDAQLLLGHESEQTTAAVYRRSNKAAVAPLKRRI